MQPEPSAHILVSAASAVGLSSDSLTSFLVPSSCGQPSSPWLLAVSPGQRISVTVIDFDLVPQPSGGGATGNGTSLLMSAAAPALPMTMADDVRCGHRPVYAIIGDRGDIARSNVTVCGGGATPRPSSTVGRGIPEDHVGIDGREPAAAADKVRERTVYKSVGHVVEIRTPSPPGVAAGSRSTWHQQRQRRYGFVLRFDGEIKISNCICLLRKKHPGLGNDGRSMVPV